MFLLIPLDVQDCAILVDDLHSNMFLLIRDPWLLTAVKAHTFTFQYVSINTKQEGDIMAKLRKFTFQYVSINTGSPIL